MSIERGKLWSKVVNDEIEIRSLTTADLEESLNVLDNSFFVNECVSIGSEINLTQNVQARAELRELCRITAGDGVSIIARHVSTNQIVAVAFNKIQYIPQGNELPFFLKFRNEQVKSKEAQSLMDFMIKVDSENDIFAKYNIDCVLELMFLATLPEWEGNKIGRALTSATIALTRNLSKGIQVTDMPANLRQYVPKAVTAIFTSLFSQKIGQSLGFELINTVPYTNFTFNGKTFADRITNPLHKSCEHVIYLL